MCKSVDSGRALINPRYNNEFRVEFKLRIACPRGCLHAGNGVRPLPAGVMALIPAIFPGIVIASSRRQLE